MKNLRCFHAFLLEQDTTGKGRIDKKTSQPEFEYDDKGEE